MSWLFNIIDPGGVNIAKVSNHGALAVTQVPLGDYAYAVSAKTGTIAAALAANSAVFAMRLDPGSTLNAYIDSIKIRWTTIAAFTTPITATRSIVVTRGSGAAPSGGTAITTATPKDTAYAASEFDAASGGDMRVSTTGALTVTGITWEPTNLGEITLIQAGAAGAFYETTYEFSATNHPIELNPGQVLGIRVGASAMDAAGTWVLNVEVNWHEGSSYTS